MKAHALVCLEFRSLRSAVSLCDLSNTGRPRLTFRKASVVNDRSCVFMAAQKLEDPAAGVHTAHALCDIEQCKRSSCALHKAPAELPLAA